MVRENTKVRPTSVKVERRASSLVGTVSVPEYLHPRVEEREKLRRPHLREVRDRFNATARDKLGFGETLRVDRDGALRRHLWSGLEEFLAAKAERKMLYWTGHGVQRGEQGYFLACADSWQSGEFAPERAVSLLDLVRLLLRPEYETDTLLIVDACSSQSYNSLGEAVRHAVELERDPDVIRAWESRRKGFAVMGTSGADAQVSAGRWVTWLEEALARPEFVADDQARPFEPSALYLPLPYLCSAVDAQAVDDGLDDPAQRPDCREIRALPNNFFDNPYYRQTDRPVHTPATLTRRRPWIEAEQFGLEEDSHLHRHFAGRRDALSRIVRWMDTHPMGLLAVTGRAGTGKTALLGRLALTSLPSWREALGADLDPATLPRSGTIHAALSCRGQSAHSLAAHLREVLAGIDGAPPMPDEPVMSETFTDAFEELVGGAGAVNLLFDALDEALPDQAYVIARHVLAPLAGIPGVRVVVGTRAQPRRRTTATAEEESLLDALEPSVEPVVLEDDEEARASITGMVLSVLDTGQSPYRGDAGRADREWTAETVAAQSHGSFLVARLAATELARRSTVATEAELLGWMRRGGVDLYTRLAEETRHLGEQPGAERAHEVLRALAVFQSPGLEREETWLTLANALREDGSPELTVEDLRRVRRSADGGIVASQKDGAGPDAGRVRHQLAHPMFGEYFLSSAGLTARDAHRRVLDALRARAGADWRGADRYTLEYLGAHAAQVGQDTLRELFEDVGFLLRTNPDVMLPLAAGLARDCDGAALYGRVAGSFARTSGDLPPAVLLERKALLSATAFVSHRDATYRTLQRVKGFLPWQEYWTDAPPDPLEWRRAGPLGGAQALSWRAGTGVAGLARTDSLTAGGLGEIQTLSPESGARLLTRRLPRSGGDRGRALREVREVGAGSGWVTVARDDQAVYFWRAGVRMPDQEYRWGGTLRALAVADVEGEGVALAADGDRVWVWSWRIGPHLDTQLREVLTADVRQLAALPLGARMFVLAAGAAQVELFEVRRTRDGVERLHACRTDPQMSPAAPTLAAAALPVSDRRGFLAAADGTAVYVWRCEAALDREPAMDLVATYPSNARGVTFGQYGDEVLLAGYEEVAVRVWSVGREGREATLDLNAPREGAMAFEPGGQGLLAVADGPYIRVVDVVPALDAGYRLQRRESNERPVLALVGALDGPALLCRSWHHTLRVSRPRLGDPAGLAARELVHERPVTAVAAVRTAGCWTVAVAAGRVVRLWCLDDSLAVVTYEDIPLGGDAGQPARALSLVRGPAADTLRLSVADGSRLVRHEVPADVSSAGNSVSDIWADRGFCGIDTRILRDGSFWTAGDLSDQLRVWTESERGIEPCLRLPANPSCLALGELYDDEDDASMPMLAWAERGSVYVKDCSVDESGESMHPRERLPGDFPDVTSLVFAGPVERPVLLLCTAETVSHAWDLWSRTFLDGPGIPARGYTVHAVRTATDPEGLVMALQGENRCDLIRLPHTFFGTATRGE